MSERQLTKCELEVMEVVWDRRRATVQEVVDALARPLAYTTVMTTMKILDTKGVLRRSGKSGRAYVYEPVVSREHIRRTMTDDLAGTLYGGSVKSLVLNLLGNTTLSGDEIDELKAAIRALEAEA